MRESGSPEILAPRETDCGEDWECRAAQISAKAMSASKFWTSDDRAPRGHRERHAKKEWSAKARNHPRVASALPHSEGIAYKPLCGEIAMCSRGGRMGLRYSPACQPYGGNPAVRNDREGRGNVGIIRSPVRASTLPD